MLTIEEPHNYRRAITHLGFRPFFLLGSWYAVAGVTFWLLLYQFPDLLSLTPGLAPVTWHAHEMIYGYTLAVIAGFLLTAVRNWTGVQTLHRWPLLLLAVLWLGARIAPLVPVEGSLWWMAALDLAFGLWLLGALLVPIWRTKAWPQLGVWFKVLLLCGGNALFYLGLLGYLPQGVQWGLYSGLYMIVALVLLMGRRVIPFFIEKGVDGPATVPNYRWVDLSSLVLMLLFWVVAVFFSTPILAATLAGALFLLHGARLVYWHQPGIWKKPLLWVLYLGYAFITLGFGLFALSGTGLLSPFIAVHAFAYGGVGVLTLGMMARVALGHTGRNVFDPPRFLTPAFALLVAGAVIRIALPPLLPELYAVWIGLAQLAWIAAFALFAWHYTPLLYLPRVDGRYG